MLNDKRRATRRPIRYTAWIKLADDELRGCVLADISDTGARVDVKSAADVPDDFILLLSSRGTAKRKCRVVWRKDGELGVTFDRKLDPTEHALKKRGDVAPPLVPDMADAAEKPEVANSAEQPAAKESTEKVEI